jgi:anti-anti-sigma regulatory factor
VLDTLLELRQRTLEREASLVLVGLDPRVKRIIEVCKLEDVFDIAPAFTDLASRFDFTSAEVRTLTLVSRAY